MSVRERFPGLDGGWTPVPRALHRHRAALGLDHHALAVVIALESHCFSVGAVVSPTIETIADETGLSRKTVMRTTSRLQALGLLTATKSSGRGRYPRNTYSLDRLWRRLAELESMAKTRCLPGTQARDQVPPRDLPGPSQGPGPGPSQGPEVDEVEVDEGKERSALAIVPANQPVVAASVSSDEEATVDRAVELYVSQLAAHLEFEPQVNTRDRRSMRTLLTRFEPGHAQDRLAAALSFALSDGFWATRVTNVSDFVTNFDKLTAAANAAKSERADRYAPDDAPPSWTRISYDEDRQVRM